MQSMAMNLVRRTLTFAVVLVATFALHPAAHAQCSATVSVDSTYDVEQTVCIETDGSDLFGYAETDANGYEGGEFDPYYLDGLATEVDVYGSDSSHYGSGMQYFSSNCCSFAETAPFTAGSGVTYSAWGSFMEYLYPNGVGNNYGSWYGPYTGTSYEQ